jgi:hypothetical protein
MNRYEKPRVEEKYIIKDWGKCYNNLFDKKLHSELNSFNYKVLHNALYTLDKFKGNKETKCFLNNCSFKESVDHIFGECPFTTENYDYYIKMIYSTKINIKEPKALEMN